MMLPSKTTRVAVHRGEGQAARAGRRPWLAFATCALLTLASAAIAQNEPTPIPANPAIVLGPPAGAAPNAADLDRLVAETAGLLRCPVCQGLSVNDSPAPLAVQMRGQVRELHAAGYTEEQVLRYFEKSYGQFVRLEPPFQGINWLVWLAPAGALLLGGFVVWRTLGRPAAAAPAAAPEATTPAVDPELQAYLERARALARGHRPPDSGERR